MEKYLSPREVCEIIPGATVNTLSQMRYRGDGPPYSKVGRTIVYPESQIYVWLKSRERTSTASVA